jgi:hypothetical protein
MSQKMLGQHQSTQTELPILDDEGRIILEPEGILTTREKKLHSRTIKEYLIKWKNLPEEDSLWETEKFRQQYPSLPCFEDKAILKGKAMLYNDHE